MAEEAMVEQTFVLRRNNSWMDAIDDDDELTSWNQSP